MKTGLSRCLLLGRGLGVADAAFRRGDLAIVVHRIGLFFALFLDDVGLFLHSILRRALGHGVGLIVGSEEHTSELQSLMRISYAVFCLKKKKLYQQRPNETSI